MENETTTPSAEFFKELAAAQSEFGTIKRECEVSFKSTSFKYADLQAILAAVKPALNKHVFFLWQKVTSNEKTVSVETFLSHSSGTLSSGVLSIPYTTGAQTAQNIGSVRTYACRYSLATFLCVAADDDNDGQQIPQTEFVLTQGMVDDAKNAAARGVAAYRAYYESQSEQLKTALVSYGWHRECYGIARKVDATKGVTA